jgi:hypothetical protein
MSVHGRMTAAGFAAFVAVLIVVLIGSTIARLAH